MLYKIYGYKKDNSGYLVFKKGDIKSQGKKIEYSFKKSLL